jgi:hypothetical protein
MTRRLHGRTWFGHYNFQELVSNSIQLLCKHPKWHHRSDSDPILWPPLKERSDVQVILPLRRRNVGEVPRRPIERTLRMYECVDCVRPATKPTRVGSKLFDLLIPKAIAVVEMDVTETRVLKLFDQSIVSGEVVNELCPHLRPLHRQDPSVFPLRFDSDVVAFFQKRLLQVFSQPNPIRFRRNGCGNSGGCRSGRRGCCSS